MALAGLGVYGFAPLSLLLPAPAAVVVGAYVVAGLGIELFNVPWFTGTQREVDPRMLARVSSLDFLLSYGLAPVGLALIAPAIDHFGPRPVLAVCAVVCFAVPAAAALVPSTREFRPCLAHGRVGLLTAAAFPQRVGHVRSSLTRRSARLSRGR